MYPREEKLEKSTTSTDVLSSIPRLLARNVRQYGDLPAYREKEYGIWQSWTWAEAADEIEALALGFIDVGLKPGEYVAIVGRNRPHFYWTMVAAQMAGAIPVPLYSDAVGEEIAVAIGPRRGAPIRVPLGVGVSAGMSMSKARRPLLAVMGRSPSRRGGCRR